ncbi:MAG TPA: DUF72 domain-containing protein [Tepidisphaeraceae bacterium]|jgi:uncharacterized protein YecE (DUF72 family)
MPDIRIGISGWTYGPWRGKFYPPGLVQNRELPYASRKLNSIEINGSFYSLQRPSSYAEWYRQTPEDFIFSVKGGRFITHMKKLRDVEDATANFFASGLLALREKLGPILWQFPPNLGMDLERFEKFFQLIPRDTREAAKLASHHTEKLKGRALAKADVNIPLRHCVEIRHPSFLTEDFVALLRRHDVSLVFADTAGIWPYTEDVTSDFIYIRLHGAEQIYWSSYSDQMLDWWQSRIELWSKGLSPCDGRCVTTKKPRRRNRDVYVYFDNDAKVAAPFDAMRLAERLGARPDTFEEAEQLVGKPRTRERIMSA